MIIVQSEVSYILIELSVFISFHFNDRLHFPLISFMHTKLLFLQTMRYTSNNNNSLCTLTFFALLNYTSVCCLLFREKNNAHVNSPNYTNKTPVKIVSRATNRIQFQFSVIVTEKTPEKVFYYHKINYSTASLTSQ